MHLHLHFYPLFKDLMLKKSSELYVWYWDLLLWDINLFSV